MEHKIIFGGPVGAGKTTAIAAISDIPVVNTEAKPSDDTAKLKATTTVAMDYGILHLDGGAKVHLYGTPGQERFSFMWDILSVGGIGFVLLLDNTRKDPLADLEFYLNSFKGLIASSAVVIGVNRMEEKARPGLYTYQTRLEQLGLKVPLFEVDPRERRDVKTLLLALLAMLDPGIQR
jgi:signal recognition particle receptor subunit beta